MREFFLYIIATLITPGPNTIISFSNGLRYGVRKGIRFNLGAFSGFSFLMLFCLLCSRTIYRIIPHIRPVMSVLGAAYMLYQAYRCLKGSAISADASSTAGFKEGFLLQFVNVKAILFGITAMSGYIVPMVPSLALQCLFAIILALTAFLCAVLWLIAGAFTGRAAPLKGKYINYISGVLLIYCAFRLLQ